MHIKPQRTEQYEERPVFSRTKQEWDKVIEETEIIYCCSRKLITFGYGCKGTQKSRFSAFSVNKGTFFPLNFVLSVSENHYILLLCVT